MSACLACGGDLKKDGELEGYVQGASYEIYSCLKCRTKSAYPHRVDASVYDYIYKNSGDTPGYMRYHEYAQDILTKKNPLKWLASQEHVYHGVAQNLPKKGRILEVGCGLGYFSYALAKGGYEVLGIDISQEAITAATNRYGNHFKKQDFFEMNKQQHGAYDAIIMIELIEHVEDPERYLTHAKSLLREGGRVIVTTPNRSWYEDTAALWASDLPPVHLTWFSEDGMNRLSERAGYRVEKVSYVLFNILHGSVVGPPHNIEINPPFFTATGQPLFPKFVHSRTYHLARRLRIFTVIKRLLNFKQKIGEIVRVLLRRNSLVLGQAPCLCVVLEPR